jgi:hypothetical protein
MKAAKISLINSGMENIDMPILENFYFFKKYIYIYETIGFLNI